MRMDRITIKPDLCGGEPTIRGMRITVSHVLEMLAGGMTPNEVLQDSPYPLKPVLNMPRVTLPTAKFC